MSEEERKAIFHQLAQITNVNWAIHGEIPSLLWLHFTDWAGSVDLPLLESEGLLEWDMTKRYIPNGTWQDHFPPNAYRVTLLAWAILRNPSQWVFTGEVDLKKAEAARLREWAVKGMAKNSDN